MPSDSHLKVLEQVALRSKSLCFTQADDPIIILCKNNETAFHHVKPKAQSAAVDCDIMRKPFAFAISFQAQATSCTTISTRLMCCRPELALIFLSVIKLLWIASKSNNRDLQCSPWRHYVLQSLLFGVHNALQKGAAAQHRNWYYWSVKMPVNDIS